MTDEETCEYVAANLTRILAEQDRTIYWLMKQLKMSPGAVYPIVRGESQPTLGTTTRIAEALGITIDDLVKKPGNTAEKANRKKIRKTA